MADSEEHALLPDPGKLDLWGAAEAAEKYSLERLTLGAIGSLVEVEEETPGEARLVVVVATVTGLQVGAGDLPREILRLGFRHLRTYLSASQSVIVGVSRLVVLPTEQ
jgi:hypothetical protein